MQLPLIRILFEFLKFDETGQVDQLKLKFQFICDAKQNDFDFQDEMISDFNSIAIVDYNSLLNVMTLVALAGR